MATLSALSVPADTVIPVAAPVGSWIVTCLRIIVLPALSSFGTAADLVPTTGSEVVVTGWGYTPRQAVEDAVHGDHTGRPA